MTLVHHSAQPTFALGPLTRFGEAIARTRRARAQARATRHLLDLDDHLLRDIGIDPHAFRWSRRLPTT